MCIRGGGASEQLGKGGGGEPAKHAPLGGSGGMLPQENFPNLQALRLNLEPSAWRHMKPSTHISEVK